TGTVATLAGTMNLNLNSILLQISQTASNFLIGWKAEQLPGGYKVIDANRQSLDYVYGRETRADAETNRPSGVQNTITDPVGPDPIVGPSNQFKLPLQNDTAV